MEQKRVQFENVREKQRAESISRPKPKELNMKKIFEDAKKIEELKKEQMI